jgi:hypothetical protein
MRSAPARMDCAAHLASLNALFFSSVIISEPKGHTTARRSHDEYLYPE